MHESIPYKISQWNRNRKWNFFKAHIDFNEKTHILDVGFTDQEFSSSDNFLEKNYPFPQHITALGIEEPQHFSKQYPDVTVQLYDGGIFPFNDNQFDVCWSNAVLEHVGDRHAQILFLKEIARVSKKAFVTTPNRFFPIEVHTRTPLLHFLPKKYFDRYLHRIGKKWATGSYMYLLSLRDIRQLLHEAGITDYTITKNKFCGFTLDFVIIF